MVPHQHLLVPLYEPACVTISESKGKPLGSLQIRVHTFKNILEMYNIMVCEHMIDAGLAQNLSVEEEL